MLLPSPSIISSSPPPPQQQEAQQISMRSRKPNELEGGGPTVNLVMDDEDSAASRMRNKNNDRKTAEMHDTMARFWMWIAFMEIIAVGGYMIVAFPHHDQWEKQKPQAVAIIVMEILLLISTTLLWCVNQKPEGKVVVLHGVLLIQGLLSGFTLSGIFKLLMTGLSED
jgi:hypothetical protein